MDSIFHRGPDSQAVFESKHVSLAAARLKIIDLAGGDQPMAANNGDTVIVFNGEIYNHAELRRELETLGHVFRSHSDTETVLRSFLQWDNGCWSRLRGMFAAAIWCESKRRLVIARDRLGIKPLYFAQRGGEIFFGSELKTLFVHPEIERVLDLGSLDCYLSLNYVPCPGTLIEGIEKLRPGHWLEWRDGIVRSEPYWRLPFPAASPWSERDASERLDSLLSSAVREHLLSDVPIGLWLSGGLDSPTILHYAAAASSAPINTFSISFAGRSFDESATIHRLVSHYGTRHNELDLNSDLPLRDAIEDFAAYADEPNADAGALPVWFLSKMTRQTATVALSGEGADELFGGYVTYRANALARLARNLGSPLLRLASSVASQLPASDEKISFEYKVKRFLAGCLLNPARAHVYWNGTFSEPEKRQILSRSLPPGLSETLAGLAAANGRAGSDLWFDQQYYLPDDILAKVDRISMAHSVEVRPPFLDHRIVEFAATLPPRLKIDGSQQKVLLRRLMRDRLPPRLANRPKIGFDIPAHEWLRGTLRPLLLDALATGASAHASLFRPGAIDTFVSDHLSHRANYGYHLWGLMILFLWMEKWKIQTDATPLSLPALAFSGIAS